MATPRATPPASLSAPQVDPDGKSLLRVVACGSVDDGKSTLLGRLMTEAGAIRGDQLATLAADSKRHGTRGDAIDHALLFDGLVDERAQGITIDVAYRQFETAARRFIVADAPGHEQYTRNMATGASTADVAIVLIDAQKGLTRQTRRHATIVALLGVRRVLLAVNKMDLVGYARERFDAIAAEFLAYGLRIGLADATAIPVSATEGDNVTRPGASMPWHEGPTLLQALERADAGDARGRAPFRLPVQWVNRPNAGFRGYAGTIVAGSVKVGDPIVVAPGMREARVARIVTADGDLAEARCDAAVTLTLDAEVDASRGDVIAAASAPSPVADRFEASMVWMDAEPLLRGRSYRMKLGTRTVNATVAPIKHRLDLETLQPMAAGKLEMNDIGVCDLELDRPIAFERYDDNRELGGFILIDRMTNNTVGAGMLRFALRRSSNVHWQSFDVDRRVRARMNAQKPCVLWFTGLSGAGKSTIANLVERALAARGHRTYLLDGDNVRRGLNKDLGFTAGDRVENVRRVAEVAALMADAGLIVLTAFISPFRAEREMARALLPEGEFVEVFVDTPLALAEARDTKGLYGKARRGELKNFTGIDSPYEPPQAPEIRIDGATTSPEAAAIAIVDALAARGVLGP